MAMKWWRVWGGGGGCVRRVSELSAEGWRDEKGRERWRKWIEIADALSGLQKINSSQEGKPQPPPCSISLAVLAPSTARFLQSSSLCSFSACLSSTAHLSRPFHVHFQSCPLLLYIHLCLLFAAYISLLYTTSSSSVIVFQNKQLESMSVFCTHWEGVAKCGKKGWVFYGDCNLLILHVN